MNEKNEDATGNSYLVQLFHNRNVINTKMFPHAESCFQIS